MERNDGESIRQTLEGERAAFAALVDRYRDAVCGLAFHHRGNFEDAQGAPGSERRTRRGTGGGCGRFPSPSASRSSLASGCSLGVFAFSMPENGIALHAARSREDRTPVFAEQQQYG